jgi:4-hydroxybenzoate polyprenyltransferase
MGLEKVLAYTRLMRLDKPVGILLLLWPTLWALWIASEGWPELNVLVIFVLGTVLMRSAGCVMNDLADIEYDGFVDRTKNRPLVNATVTKTEGMLLALVLSAIAFVLVCQLNALTIKLSFIAVFLAMSYPFTKRFFSMPQAYLGIAFGFGIPMAFAAVNNVVPMTAWLMLLANIFWAIAYDTAYAMVDRDDDLKIGIRSSAITFGQYDVLAIMVCYAVTLGLLIVIGQQLMFNYAYYLGLLVAFVIAVDHLFMLKTRQKMLCFKVFLGNVWFGLAIFLGVFFMYLSRTA